MRKKGSVNGCFTLFWVDQGHENWGYVWGRKGTSRTQWKIVKVYRVTEMEKQTKEETLVRLCGQGNVISK